MTSHLRSTPRTIGVTSSPERIRRQWQELQPWLSGMRNEEETKRQREFEELRLATERRIKTQGSRSETITTIQADFEKEKKALWDKMKDRVVSRGKQEWAARLQRADLTMDQWTDITIEENSAVAAVMWGVDEDSIAAEGSETETESITPTPSRSSRGPQLWTPPDISKVAELPASNANSAVASSDVQGNSGDSTPAARRSPVLTQSKFGGSASTPAKAVASEWKAQNKLSEQQAANPQPRVVAPKLQNRARVVPAGVKRDLYQDVSSWPEDDATLLPTSHEVTEDERYFDDTDDDDDVSLKAPAYQKVNTHAKWKPAKPDTTAQPKAAVQPKTPTPPKNSTLPKASTQLKAPNLHNTRTTSNTSVQSNVNTEAPRMHPVELAPASLDPNESDLDQQFRKQIEETLRPMYNEAREYEATNEKLYDQIDLMGKIQQIANDLYFVKQYIAIMQAPEKQGKAPSKANPNVGPAVDRGTHPNQTDGPTRTPNTPPSPLTPPVTPNDAKRYIGPILVDEEEDLFDDVALAIRRQKILEFHEAAAVLDISVAEELHQHKGNKRKVNQMLKRRQEEAEELQMKKEKERKDATDLERKRRRAEIDARAQNGESTERHDPHHRHTKQTPRPSSSQQKARDDGNGRSKDPSYRSQARTGHAGDTRANVSTTKHGQTTNGTSRTPGLVNRNNPAGSHVLFSTDPVNRQKKGAGTDGPHFGSRQSSRITPLTPTVGLPDIDSDDDEGDDESMTSSLDDDESLASGPNVDEHKHVRFTPSVLADNSTESSERTSTLFNTSGLRPGLDSDVYRAILSGPGSGKGATGGATMQPTKTAGMGSGWGKEEKNIPEFWIPTPHVTPRW